MSYFVKFTLAFLGLLFFMLLIPRIIEYNNLKTMNAEAERLNLEKKANKINKKISNSKVYKANGKRKKK